MSKSDSRLFVGTAGARITRESISEHREKFLGKTVGQIDKMLRQRGYETTIRKSKFSTSRAKVIVVGNSSKERNITQVQVSPGSKRHGDVPYVKISTNDIGIQKIINADHLNTKLMVLKMRRFYLGGTTNV